MQKILDIGSGPNRHPGAVTLDRSPLVNPDVQHDLDAYPYPFDDNSFEHIICHHVVEHIADVVLFMEEVHRILAHGGTIQIITPHFSSSNSWTDPTHKQHLGFYAFDFFCEAQGPGRVDYYTTVEFEIRERRLEFHNRHRRLGLEWLFNKFPRSWEKYYCWRAPAKNIHITLAALKST